MRTILFIGLISVFVVVSGCVDNRQKTDLDFKSIINNIYSSFKDLMESLSKTEIAQKFSKLPPDYEVKVTEVRSLQECIQNLDVSEPCLLVNLDIINMQNESVTFELTEKSIVTKDGKQLEKYGGLYNTKELNALCDSVTYMKLFPNARKNIGFCFPPVSKNDGPVLYLGVIANGVKKEHNFDISLFLK